VRCIVLERRARQRGCSAPLYLARHVECLVGIGRLGADSVRLTDGDPGAPSGRSVAFPMPKISVVALCCHKSHADDSPAPILTHDLQTLLSYSSCIPAHMLYHAPVS
jgi:hypothetical protein